MNRRCWYYVSRRVLCVHVYAQSLSHVQLFVTRWTVVCQAPLSTDSPGKNTGMGCHALLQGIFLAQGLNPLLLRLLHCRQTFFYC